MAICMINSKKLFLLAGATAAACSLAFTGCNRSPQSKAPAWGYQPINPKDIVSTFNPNNPDGIDPAKNAGENMDASVLDGFVEGPQEFNSYTGRAWLENGNIRVKDNSAKQITDKVDSKGIFEFYLHAEKDMDKTNTDRQRIEIRGDSPERTPDFAAKEDDIITYFWKFFLPEDIAAAPPPGHFHIFQDKAVQGREAGSPILTFSINRNNLVFRNTTIGLTMDTTEVIASVPLQQVLNRWLSAEITAHYRDVSDTKPGTKNGYLYIKLTDLETGLALMEAHKACDLWRRPEARGEDGIVTETGFAAAAGQYIRPKWGLYRAYRENAVMKEVSLLWADMLMIKRDKESYRFPDGYNPAEAGGIPVLSPRPPAN